MNKSMRRLNGQLMVNEWQVKSKGMEIQQPSVKSTPKKKEKVIAVLLLWMVKVIFIIILSWVIACIKQLEWKRVGSLFFDIWGREQVPPGYLSCDYSIVAHCIIDSDVIDNFLAATTHLFRRSRPSVRRSVRRSVPPYFRTTNMAVFEGKKSSNDIINNGTMSDDEVVASFVPPRYLFWSLFFF